MTPTSPSAPDLVAWLAARSGREQRIFTDSPEEHLHQHPRHFLEGQAVTRKHSKCRQETCAEPPPIRQRMS